LSATVCGKIKPLNKQIRSRSTGEETYYRSARILTRFWDGPVSKKKTIPRSIWGT
jgi:hypothetical protein